MGFYRPARREPDSNEADGEIAAPAAADVAGSDDEAALAAAADQARAAAKRARARS
ncbi:MAG TPA: hypothetical protein VK507_02670 [Iamia sp.]|nr:hypothetical protein [Iamia sp.]